MSYTLHTSTVIYYYTKYYYIVQKHTHLVLLVLPGDLEGLLLQTGLLLRQHHTHL